MPKKAARKATKAPKPAKSAAVSRPAPKAKAEKPAAKTKDEPKRIVDGDDEFAEFYEVSTRTVQTWRKKGMPCEKTNARQYQYDLDLTDPWVATFRKADQTAAAAEINQKINDAELRIKLATALKKERELEREAGNVLLRDEYELHLVERNQRVRDFILSIPQQMRKHMPRDSKKPLAELTKLIDKALNQLADTGQSE